MAAASANHLAAVLVTGLCWRLHCCQCCLKKLEDEISFKWDKATYFALRLVVLGCVRLSRRAFASAGIAAQAAAILA